MFEFEYRTHTYIFTSKRFKTLKAAQKAAADFADGDKTTERLTSFFEINPRGLRSARLDCGPRWRQPEFNTWVPNPITGL